MNNISNTPGEGVSVQLSSFCSSVSSTPEEHVSVQLTSFCRDHTSSTPDEAVTVQLRFDNAQQAQEFAASQNKLTNLVANVFASPSDKLNALIDLQDKIHRPLTKSATPQDALTLNRILERAKKALLSHLPCSIQNVTEISSSQKVDMWELFRADFCRSQGPEFVSSNLPLLQKWFDSLQNLRTKTLGCINSGIFIEKATEFASPQMFDMWGHFRTRLCQTVGPVFFSYNQPLIRDVFNFLQNPSTITPGCIDRDLFDDLKYGLECHERLLLASGVSTLHHLYEAEELRVLDKVPLQVPLNQIPKAMLLRHLCTLGEDRKRWLDFPISAQDGDTRRRDTLSFEQYYVLVHCTEHDFARRSDHLFHSTFRSKTIIEIKYIIEESFIEDALAPDFFAICCKTLTNIIAMVKKSEISQNVSKEILEVEMYEAKRAGIAFITSMLEEQRLNIEATAQVFFQAPFLKERYNSVKFAPVIAKLKIFIDQENLLIDFYEPFIHSITQNIDDWATSTQKFQETLATTPAEQQPSLHQAIHTMFSMIGEYTRTLEAVRTIIAPLWTPAFPMGVETLDWKVVATFPPDLIQEMFEDSQSKHTISAHILTTWLVGNNFLQELSDAEKIVAYVDLCNCIRVLREHKFDEQSIKNFVSTVSNISACGVTRASDINLFWLVTKLLPEHIRNTCDISENFSHISLFNYSRFLAAGGIDVNDFFLLSSHFTPSTVATICLNKETIPGLVHMIKATPENLRIFFSAPIKYDDLALLPGVVVSFLEETSEHRIPQQLLLEWLTRSERLLETGAARAMSEELQNYLLLYQTLRPKALDEDALITFFGNFENEKERDPNLRSPSIPKCIAALKEDHLQHFLTSAMSDGTNIPSSTKICFYANAVLPLDATFLNILVHLSTLLSPGALFAACEHPSLLSWMIGYSKTDSKLVQWMDTLFRANIPIKTIVQHFSQCVTLEEVRKLLASKDIDFIRQHFTHAVHIATCISEGPCVKLGAVRRIDYDLFAQDLSLSDRFNILESFPRESRPSWSLLYDPWGRLNLSAFSWLPLSSVPIDPLLVYLAHLPFSTASAWLDEIMPTPDGEKKRVDTLSEEQKRAILVRFHQFDSFLPLQHWVEKLSMQGRTEEIAAMCTCTTRPMSEEHQRLHFRLQNYIDPMDPISLFVQIHMMEEPWGDIHLQIVFRLLETAEESIICGPRFLLTWGHAGVNTLCHALDTVPLQSEFFGSRYSLQNQGVFNDFSTPTSPIEVRNRLIHLKESSPERYTNLIESLKDKAFPSIENTALFLEISRLAVHMRERYPHLPLVCATNRKKPYLLEASEPVISNIQCPAKYMVHTSEITGDQVVPMEAFMKDCINKFNQTFLDVVKTVNGIISHTIDFQKNNEDCGFIRPIALGFLTFLFIGRLASIQEDKEKCTITYSPLISFQLRALPDTIVSHQADNPGYAEPAFAQLVTEYQPHTLSTITPDCQCTPKAIVALFRQLQSLSPSDLQQIIRPLLALINPQTLFDPASCFAAWEQSIPSVALFSPAARHWFVTMVSKYSSFFSPPMPVLKENTLYLFNPRKVDSFCPREMVPNELLSEGNYASACCARFESVIPVVHNNNCGVNSFLMALHDRTYTQAQAQELNQEVGMFHAAVVQYATNHRDALIVKYGDLMVNDVISTYGNFQTWASPVVWECAAQLYGRPIHVYSRKQYHNGVFFKTDSNGIVEPTGGVYEPEEIKGSPFHLIHWDGIHYALLKPRR